jgi:hypothetical protein
MFNQTLNNLPKPETQSFIEQAQTIYNETFKLNIFMLSIFAVIVALLAIIYTMSNEKSEHKPTNFLIAFATGEIAMIVTLTAMSLMSTSVIAIGQIKNEDYLTDNDSELNKILPGTNTKPLSLKENNNDNTGKSGIDIYYHDLKIAKIKNNKYHALNQQGKQYEQLMNTLLKITNGKHYTVLKIKDTDTNDLKMSFIYQNHTYLISFKNNSKPTIIKL